MSPPVGPLHFIADNILVLLAAITFIERCYWNLTNYPTVSISWPHRWSCDKKNKPPLQVFGCTHQLRLHNKQWCIYDLYLMTWATNEASPIGRSDKKVKHQFRANIISFLRHAHKFPPSQPEIKLFHVASDGFIAQGFSMHSVTWCLY